VWVKKGTKYALFKRYEICYYSGGLGTKTKQGDGKSPEGFYTITAKQLNPASNYHLAINIGYPNQLEQQKGYTGRCHYDPRALRVYRLLRYDGCPH
jgi:murein L,D-transpeptidase YafK